MVKLFAAHFLILVSLMACTPSMGPDKVGETFLKAYYGNADLKTAGPLTSGLAEQKIDDEIKLGGGQPGATGESHRQIDYAQIADMGKKEGDDTETRKNLFYQIRVMGSNASEINLLVRVTVEKVGGQWKVVNFVES